MCAKNDVDAVTTLEFGIDGRELHTHDLLPYRFKSLPFDAILPLENLYQVTPGIVRSVSDGYWLMLKPLPEGMHEILVTTKALLIRSGKKNQR